MFAPEQDIDLYAEDLVDACARIAPASIRLLALDPPYMTNNTKKKYHTDILEQKQWTNFHAEWDVWPTIEAYTRDVEMWIECMRPLLTDDGSMWVCGSHHSIPTWDLALRRQGLWVQQWVQWCIPNAMPNIAMSQMASSNQTIIWARKSKKGKHVYNGDVAKEINKGKNLRDYWLINNDSQAGKLWKHPSKKPVALIERMIRLATRPGDTVADFFGGSGTTGVAVRNVNARHGLNLHGILSEKHLPYVEMIEQRLHITRKGKGNETTDERPGLPVHVAPTVGNRGDALGEDRYEPSLSGASA